MAFSPTDLAALGSTPIRPEQPGGESVTYDPDFEAIKAEIAKIDSLKGEIPDWSRINDLAGTILQQRSKDLTVASFLCLSLFREKGYVGLAGGLSLYSGLLTNFWDVLFPEINRMRGRASAVNWLNERVGAAVAKKPASTSDHEAATSCQESLREIQAVVGGDKFAGAEAPSLGDLRRALDDAVRASTPSAAPAAAASSTGSSEQSAIDSPDAAYRVLRKAGQEIGRAAAYLAAEEPGSPAGYLALRGVAWAGLSELPPDADGETQFPTPDPGAPGQWEQWVAQGSWKALLEDAEPRLIDSPLWLDINYYVSLALENMGHDAAAGAVTDQTLVLAARFPRLLELKFQDGRPYASETTRAWLAAERAERWGTPGGGDGGAATVDPLAEGAREARALVSRGKLADAVRMLQERIELCPSPREQFRWRLLMAGLCADAGQTAVAAVQLNSLDREIERHGLEAWEPELSVQVLTALYQCEKKLSENGHREAGDSLQRLDRLYDRLCRIDVLSALTLEGKK